MFRQISSDVLRIDAAGETGRIVDAIRDIIFRRLKRQGAVVGVSGGIDSSVVAFLCARALGKESVVALLTRETESSPESLRLARMVADSLGVQSAVEDIGPVLKAAHCYKRRDDAVQKAVPEYRSGYRCRIVQPTVHEPQTGALYSVVVRSPEGRSTWVPLTPEAYQDIVAAANLKQRARKMMEYYYADRLQYAVAGTANRLEHDQGLFVKNGDGAADLKPIAHLYKSQVCQLAAYLGVPEQIRRRPMADMYPLEDSREDLYFILPLEKMDLCLYGKDHGIPAPDLAAAVGLEAGQVQDVYDAIEAKRNAAEYLRADPLLVRETAEVQDPGLK
ncbi:MAG: NAD(+) synthase [Acidobacteriia bacterium]|nr:NAD(+) synthase [Terriglobia bacterium]